MAFRRGCPRCTKKVSLGEISFGGGGIAYDCVRRGRYGGYLLSTHDRVGFTTSTSLIAEPTVVVSRWGSGRWCDRIDKCTRLFSLPIFRAASQETKGTAEQSPYTTQLPPKKRPPNQFQNGGVVFPLEEDLQTYARTTYTHTTYI